MVPTMGAVCAGAKRSNIYLVNTILGVFIISQDQWDPFNQLGPSRRDASINSVQSKCGKHGGLNEVWKRGSPNPVSNMRWGFSLGLKIIIRASRGSALSAVDVTYRLLTSRHSREFWDSSHYISFSKIIVTRLPGIT